GPRAGREVPRPDGRDLDHRHDRGDRLRPRTRYDAAAPAGGAPDRGAWPRQRGSIHAGLCGRLPVRDRLSSGAVWDRAGRGACVHPGVPGADLRCDDRPRAARPLAPGGQRSGWDRGGFRVSLAAAPARSASARAPVAKARAVPWSVVAGLLFWLAAVAAGYRAQHFLTPENQVVAGALWYGAAVVLAVAGIGLIDRRAAPREQRAAEPTLAPRVWRAPRQAVGLALTLVGVAVGAGMTYLLWIQPRGGFVAPKALFFDPSTVYGKAFWLWVVAMAAVLGGAALMARNPPRLSWARPSRAGLIELAGVLGLLAITLAYRLIGLPQIPYEVHGDEAAIGVAARAIMHGDAPSLFWVGWADVPNMSYAIPAAFMSLVGDNLFGLRIASVVQGTLSVLLTYLIARRLFGWRIGLVAGVLLAMNHWHVHFSRTGFHYMQAVFAGTLFVYLMLRAIDTRRAANWLLAGFAVGLGFEVYYGARIAPVIGAVYLVHQAVRDRAFFTKHWSGVLAMCGGALLFAAPVIVFFVQHPDTFLNRTNGVSVTNPDIQNHLIRSFGVNTLGEAMLIQLRNSVLAFNQRGETSLQYGHHGP